jgi:hypothetical protein
MRAALALNAEQHARPMTAWRACACAIDRHFVVIRLKHLAV